MKRDTYCDETKGLSGRLLWVGGVMLLIGVVAVVGAAVWPLPTDGVSGGDGRPGRAVPKLDDRGGASAGWYESLTGSRLIRPAQVQAAVKDTGAAERLLRQLKLQSVVEMDGEATAYVRVDQRGVQTVRAGGRLLDFLVESIRPGEVRLSLDGVVVALHY